MKCIKKFFRINKKYSLTLSLLVSLTIWSGEIRAQAHSVLQNPAIFYYNRLASDTSENLTLINNILYEDNEYYFKILNPRTSASFNSTYARGYNDGPLWKGRGLSQDFDFGIQWKYKFLRLNIEPFIYFSQNASFRLATINPNQNPYNYQFGVSRNVDFVQKYGSDSFVKFHPGQSEIALQFQKFKMGVSTQNFTLGPAIHNHIIMSNSAEGLPHLTFGTAEKVDLKIRNVELGKFEAHLFYGLLSESNYFDSLANNDRRYINGMSIGYEVPYLTGLTIGFQRMLYKNTKYFESFDLYSMFYIKDEGLILSAQGDTLIDSNDTFDQLASAFIEWKLIDKDLRLYFEYARNDFNGSLRRLITEFEHSRAYTLGFEKAFNLATNKKLYLGYEHTFLPRYMSYQYRPNPPFYTHHITIQGYTNKGQLLGAGIGPGSVSDIFTLNWINANRLTGVSFQRIRFDEDYFISKVPNTLDKIGQHDIEFTLGLNYSKQMKKIHWGIESDLSYRLNMYFEKNNDKINFAGRVFAQYLINNN